MQSGLHRPGRDIQGRRDRGTILPAEGRPPDHLTMFRAPGFQRIPHQPGIQYPVSPVVAGGFQHLVHAERMPVPGTAPIINGQIPCHRDKTAPSPRCGNHPRVAGALRGWGLRTRRRGHTKPINARIAPAASATALSDF